MFDGKPLNKFLHDEFDGKSREQLEKERIVNSINEDIKSDIILCKLDNTPLLDFFSKKIDMYNEIVEKLKQKKNEQDNRKKDENS